MSPPETATESTPLKVRRGRVASVDLYEVKDSELDLLENGSPASIQLNFSVFLLSLAFSSIAALCTADFKSDIAKTIFIVIAVTGVIIGAYLLIIWWKTMKSISAVVHGIRERMEPPPPLLLESLPEVKTKPVAETEPSG